jgi:hypothetical protein
MGRSGRRGDFEEPGESKQRGLGRERGGGQDPDRNYRERVNERLDRLTGRVDRLEELVRELREQGRGSGRP